MRQLADPEGMYQAALRETERLIPLFKGLADERGLAKAWNVAAHSHLDLEDVTAAQEAWWRAAQHADAAGDQRERTESLSWLALAARFGPTPARAGIDVCDLILDKAGGNRKVNAYVLDARCVLEAMQGRFPEARRTARQAQRLYDELGLKVMAANLPQNSGYVEMLAGDVVSAEQEYRRGYELLQEMGERSFLSTVAALMSDAVNEQGRLDEAEQLTRISEETAASDDIMSQATWRSVRAKVLAQRGELEQADALAREAVHLVDGTEWPDDRAQVRMGLGQVLRMAHRSAEAAEVISEAVDLYEQKGNIVSAARARVVLGELRGTSAHA